MILATPRLVRDFKIGSVPRGGQEQLVAILAAQLRTNEEGWVEIALLNVFRAVGTAVYNIRSTDKKVTDLPTGRSE